VTTVTQPAASRNRSLDACGSLSESRWRRCGGERDPVCEAASSDSAWRFSIFCTAMVAARANGYRVPKRDVRSATGR